MTDKNLDEEKARKEYLDERKFLVSLEQKAYTDFDKTLLTISSGAIALSIAFLDKALFQTYIYLLVTSWIMWLLSIFFQLGSFIVSSKAMREEVVILTERYKGAKTDRDNKYFGHATSLNYTALCAFVIGTLSFIIFILLNQIYV